MRSKPPSRLRYEKSHPVLSARVSQEVKEHIKDYQLKTGKSVADILKEAIKIQDESYELAYLQGYDEGFNEAKSQYRISFPCSVCGQEIEITNEDTKQEVRGYMVEHKWGHSSCLRR